MSLSVTSTGLEIPGAARDALTEQDVAARLLRKDATLWGPEAEDFCAHLNVPGPITLRVNPLRTSREALAQLRDRFPGEWYVARGDLVDPLRGEVQVISQLPERVGQLGRRRNYRRSRAGSRG